VPVGPLILSFNTATPDGSVCIVDANQVLASVFSDPSVSHSNTLLREIDHALKVAGVSLAEVEILAVAAGPGSFTGLRIGLASVKALATALARPCFGIPTLHAVAHAAGTSPATVAALPAGRGEVFVQLLSVSPTGAVAELDLPAHLPPQRMLEKYGSLPRLVWAGQGARVHADAIKASAPNRELRSGVPSDDGPAWSLAETEKNLAADIALLAADCFQRGLAGNVESLAAIYVRPSDAELKRNVSQ
jgi:tRNA threonylcarbamoyladenosine biosynthesis protein TsaB